jgi:hypothetical protein
VCILLRKVVFFHVFCSVRVIRRICATQYLLTVHLNVRQTVRKGNCTNRKTISARGSCGAWSYKDMSYIPNDFKARKINIPPSYRVCRSTRHFFYENEIRHLYAYSILFTQEQLYMYSTECVYFKASTCPLYSNWNIVFTWLTLVLVIYSLAVQERKLTTEYIFLLEKKQG